MPWALSSNLSDDKLFMGPKHNINALFMILFGVFDLILCFVCQISHVKQKIENKRNLFLKIIGNFYQTLMYFLEKTEKWKKASNYQFFIKKTHSHPNGFY